MRQIALLALLALAACSSGSADDSDLEQPTAGAGGGSTGGAAGGGGSKAGGGGSGASSGTAGASGGAGGAQGGAAGSSAGASGTAGSGAGAGGESGSSGQGGSSGMVCTPGQSVACTGPAGCQGGQACKADGSGYEACDCGGAGAGGAAGTGGSGSSGTAGTSGSAGSGGQQAVCSCSSLVLPLTNSAKGDSVNFGPNPGTVCPGGADATASPQECVLDLDLPGSQLSVSMDPSGNRFITGKVRVRVPHMKFQATVSLMAKDAQMSLGQSQGSDCSAADYTLVGLSAAFPPVTAAPNSCTALGTATKFELTYPDADVHFCGSCDTPVVCSTWNASVSAIKAEAQKRWTEAVRAQFEALSVNATCL